MKSHGQRILYAVDCDNTIVDGDSDMLIPELVKNPLPEEVNKHYDGHYFTDFMNAVFQHLFEQGVTLGAIERHLKKIPFVKGVPELLKKLKSSCSERKSSKFVVISDANNFSIEKILENIGITLEADSMITNQAEIDEDGKIRIHPFEYQKSCSHCPQNMCKGSALQQFIRDHGPFERVIYIGDGKNDICPASKLNENDIVFARSGYALHKIIQSGHKNGKPVSVAAQVKYWEDGFQIQSELANIFNNYENSQLNGVTNHFE